MGESRRVELDGALAGCHILIDLEQLDVGALEDLESNKIGTVKRAIGRLIVGGDLPHGTDDAGLRRLKVAEFGAIMDGMLSLLQPKKVM